jgi:hypothetical protein
MKAAHAALAGAAYRKSGYLGGFWRDVGFHRALLAVSGMVEKSKVANQGSRNPTSREKRARYGAPDLVAGQETYATLLVTHHASMRSRLSELQIPPTLLRSRWTGGRVEPGAGGEHTSPPAPERQRSS